MSGSALVLDGSGFDAIRTLAEAGMVTPTSLALDDGTGVPIPYERFVTLGAYIGSVRRSSQWWVGDWLIYGEGAYGDRLEQAAVATGLSEQTLLNCVSVCRAIAPSRRRAALPFGVHEPVARLSAREQTKWLDRAEKNGWTREDLRRALADAESGGKQQEILPPAGKPKPAVVMEAAVRVVRSRREMGDGWLVSREAMAALEAALDGE